jgi:DNA-binding CsgD family transcriptional regulator
MLRPLGTWPLLLASIVLLRAWDLHVFQRAFLAGTSEGMVPLWLVIVLVEMTAFLLFALLPHRSRRLFSWRGCPALQTALLALGALLLLLGLGWAGGGLGWADGDRGPAWPLLWPGAVCAGLGLSGLRVEMGRFLGFLGMKPALLFNLMSLPGAALLFVLSNGALGGAQWMLTLALPALGCALLVCERARSPQVRRFLRDDMQDTRARGAGASGAGMGADAGAKGAPGTGAGTGTGTGAGTKGAPGSGEQFKVPVKFIATSFIQGICFSLAFCLLSLSPSFGSDALPIGMVGLALAFLLAAGTMILARYGFNTLIYRVAFPLLGLGFMLVGLLPPGFAMGTALLVAGFFFLDTILWSLVAFLIRNKGIPAGWAIHLPRFALACGKSLGGLLILLACRVPAPWDAALAPWDAPQPAWCVLAFLVTLAALLMASNVNLRFGWGFMGIDDADGFEEHIEACKLIAQDVGLTRKEYETLLLLAQGHQRKEIASALVVSPNTVKTHTLSIYRKLDVHSQEDLMRIIQRYVRSLGDAASAPPPAALADDDNA